MHLCSAYYTEQLDFFSLSDCSSIQFVSMMVPNRDKISWSADSPSSKHTKLLARFYCYCSTLMLLMHRCSLPLHCHQMFHLKHFLTPTAYSRQWLVNPGQLLGKTTQLLRQSRPYYTFCFTKPADLRRSRGVLGNLGNFRIFESSVFENVYSNLAIRGMEQI